MYLQTRYDFVKLFKEHQVKVAVELGVREGYFSYYLLKQSPISILYSVDNWKDSWQNGKLEAYKSLGHFGGRSKILEMRTTEASKLLKETKVVPDFVYIDANHRYTAVKQDIAEWYDLLRPGGILAGHDYIEGEGVVPAVDEFIKATGLTLNLTDDHMKSWWVVKPGGTPIKTKR